MANITCPECGAELLAEESSRKFVICPYCGAHVRINISVNYNFNYSKSEHTEHIVDEAKSKSADNVNRVIGIFATPFEEYRAKKDHERRMEEEEQRMADDRIRRYEEQIRADKEYARARQEERERQWRAYRKNFFKLCKRHPKETLITLVVCTLALIIGVSEWSNYSAKKQQELQHGAELARLEHEQIAYSHLADGEVQMPDINTDDDYRIVKQDFENAGFTNITTEAVADLTNTTTARYNRVIEVTVDGVPRLEAGNWYPMDVPIVITYHTVGDTILTPEQEAWSIAQGLLHGAGSSNSSEATSKTNYSEEAAWSTAHEAMTDVIDRLNEFANDLDHAADLISEQAGPSEYDCAFVREGLDHSVYYLVDYDNGLVYSCDEYDDSDIIPSATVAHIISGDLDTALIIHYNYLSGWDETLTFDGDAMILTDGNGFTRRFKKEKTYVAEVALDRAVLEKEN